MIGAMLGPLALCRLDAPLVDRIRRGERMATLLAELALWIVVGAAAYGLVLGGWRSPLQGVYAALKLPLLLAAIVATTALANSVFAKIARTQLDTVQILCGSMLSMAILSILLGALAPIGLLVSASVPQYGESLVGIDGEAASVARGHAELLLAFHVGLIGLAGMLALKPLRRLVRVLVADARRRNQLLSLSFAAQAIAGTQLSWILRPYLGKPRIPVEFFRPDAFSGSFLEEVGRWLGLA